MTNATRVSRCAAGCLILAAAANLTAVVLFNLCDGVNNGPPPTHAYLVLERGQFMVGMLVSAFGLCLLAERDRGLGLLRFGTGYLAAGRRRRGVRDDGPRPSRGVPHYRGVRSARVPRSGHHRARTGPE
jgi:hypothetical protein